MFGYTFLLLSLFQFSKFFGLKRNCCHCLQYLQFSVYCYQISEKWNLISGNYNPTYNYISQFCGWVVTERGQVVNRGVFTTCPRVGDWAGGGVPGLRPTGHGPTVPRPGPAPGRHHQGRPSRRASAARTRRSQTWPQAVPGPAHARGHANRALSPGEG